MNKNLTGKRALVMGVANNKSLAWAISEHLSACGAEVAISYQSERMAHRLQPLIDTSNIVFSQQCDVSNEEDITKLFETVNSHWDGLDILVHAIAYAGNDALSHRLIDIDKQDFLTSLDISVYSLIAVAKKAEPLMADEGGSIVTLSYHGGQKVIPHYNVMGIAKAALENTVRYLASELGSKKIRVNAVSAGPIKTLSSSAMPDINSNIELAAERAPLKENITAHDVAAMTGFLCSDDSGHMTGGVHYVDSGLNILGA